MSVLSGGDSGMEQPLYIGCYIINDGILAGLDGEEMLVLMLGRSDANAPNQVTVFSQAAMEGKCSLLNESGHSEFTYKVMLE